MTCQCHRSMESKYQSIIQPRLHVYLQYLAQSIKTNKIINVPNYLVKLQYRIKSQTDSNVFHLNELLRDICYFMLKMTRI